jgi:hypothetical protein
MILMGEPEKGPLGRPRLGWGDDIEIWISEWGGMDCIDLVHDSNQ